MGERKPLPALKFLDLGFTFLSQRVVCLFVVTYLRAASKNGIAVGGMPALGRSDPLYPGDFAFLVASPKRP